MQWSIPTKSFSQRICIVYEGSTIRPTVSHCVQVNIKYWPAYVCLGFLLVAGYDLDLLPDNSFKVSLNHTNVLKLRQGNCLFTCEIT